MNMLQRLLPTAAIGPRKTCPYSSHVNCHSGPWKTSRGMFGILKLTNDSYGDLSFCLLILRSYQHQLSGERVGNLSKTIIVIEKHELQIGQLSVAGGNISRE